MTFFLTYLWFQTLRFDQFISYIIWYSLARIKIKTENHLKSFHFMYYFCFVLFQLPPGIKMIRRRWMDTQIKHRSTESFCVSRFSRFIESCLEIVSDYKMISFHLSIIPLWKQKYIKEVVKFAEKCWRRNAFTI
jgi:hypothetical protein